MVELQENTGFFCSEVSRDVQEQLFGTCVRVDVWLLLEYSGTWGAKAFEDSTLPDNVKNWLSQQLAAVPNTRLQLIKQTAEHDDISFYVAVTREDKPALYRYRLASYADLLDMNLPEILAGDSAAITEDMLFLVCTNGKRDRCCAKFGLPLFNALSQIAGDAVWQTTHIAGHRFAATMLCFPHGLCYGRLQPEDASEVVTASQSERILLDKFRGRSAYSPLAQAAEYYLRAHTELMGFDDVTLPAFDEQQRWVEFMVVGTKQRYRLQLSVSPSAWLGYASCSASKPDAVTQYHLAGIEAL